MENEKVKEAIAWLEPFDININLTPDHISAVKTLLSLAQDYLKWSGSSIVPEEIKDEDKPDIEGKGYFDLYKNGFNQCRHNLLMKLVGLEEKISKTIKNYAFNKNGTESGRLCGHFYHDLAHAIVQALQGGPDDVKE